MGVIFNSWDATPITKTRDKIGEKMKIYNERNLSENIIGLEEGPYVIIDGEKVYVQPSEDPSSKIAEVTDWGTEADSNPRAITKAVFPTNVSGVYELYTSPSSGSGTYSHPALSEIVTDKDLATRFGLRI